MSESLAHQMLREIGVLEIPATLDNTLKCSGEYTCDCAGCEIDRQRASKRGVRPSQPLPMKRQRAA